MVEKKPGKLNIKFKTDFAARPVSTPWQHASSCKSAAVQTTEKFKTLSQK